MNRLPIFFIGNRINRWEGLLFLAYFVAYTSYLILSSSHHRALPAYNQAMIFFAIPLTVVTLLILFIREVFSGFKRSEKTRTRLK